MKIIHHYVDLEGKTHFDEYKTKIPLTMDGGIETYHVVLLLPQNYRTILDLYDQLFDPFNSKKDTELLVAAIPDRFIDLINDFEAAKYEIRRICFETPSPELGGVRPVEKIDIATGHVLVKLMECYPFSISALIKANLLNEKVNLNDISWDPTSSEAATKLILAVSAHPLWKRFSFIGLPPETFASILTLIPSPVWFLNSDNSIMPNKFWSYCGFSNNNEQVFNLLGHALFLNQQPIPLTNQITLKNYFSSLCLKALLWFEGPLEARFAFGKWYESLRIATYFWLNFLELHRKDSPFSFDEKRFFKDDALVSEWKDNLV